MVTRQQSADEALREFQEARRRIERLMQEFFAPYVSEDEYNEAMRRVSEEIAS